jgi:Protein of unknown function (DUF2786)
MSIFTDCARTEKLADRIRKLLALAGNNPSEAEAAMAMERASALMAKHNLSMAEVQTVGTEDERIEDQSESSGRRQTWARYVWDATSKLNFCFYFYRKARGHQNDLRFIIGTRGNVEATKVMAFYLVETVERLARECRQIRGVQEYHAFKLGCAHRLAARLARLREERKAETVKQTLAIASNLPTVADLHHKHDLANRIFYTERHGNKLKRGGGGTTSQFSAYARGKASGDEIGLSTQVKAQRRIALASTIQPESTLRGSGRAAA